MWKKKFKISGAPYTGRRHWWSALRFNGYVAHGKSGLQTIWQYLHALQLLG